MTPIVTVPDQVLRQPAKPVLKLDQKLLDLIAAMTETLLATRDPEGVGLAAPQVGVSLRLFLMRPRPGRDEPQVFINPEIVKYSQRLQSPDSKNGVYEGCLSLPGHYAPVTRSMSVTVKFQRPDPAGAKLVTHRQTFSGFPAHIIQHETDHLNGILFIDRVLEQNVKLYRVEGKSWTEITI